MKDSQPKEVMQVRRAIVAIVLAALLAGCGSGKTVDRQPADNTTTTGKTTEPTARPL